MSVAFRVTGFAGVVPRTGARLLADNQAQVAVNCRLTSGYIGPLKQPKLVYTPAMTGVQSIFRMTDGSTEWWLTWAADVDAVKGPIAGDTTYRTYYTGDGEPRVTNIQLATALAPYPNGWYVLGVYPPAIATSVSHAGGVGAAVTRAFVYTFVTPWGEESQPSPASALVTGKTDGTWTLGAVTPMDTAPPNTSAVTGASWVGGVATLTLGSTFGYRVGEEIKVTAVNPSGYNTTKSKITALTATTISYLVTTNPGAYTAGGTITRIAPHNTTGMTKRIYWTETLADGTHYRLVKEIAVAVTTDTVAGAAISYAELVSLDWVMPPTDGKCIRMMANGIAVLLSGNTVCFSPSYIPYAFPIAYRQTTDFDVVGLEVVGNMVVAGTKGVPYYAAGVDPVGMVLTKVDQPWPCLAKRSMINAGGGVEYASPVGKVQIGPSGASITTHDLYTLEEWKLLNPDTFTAAEFGGRYVTAYKSGVNARQVLIIDKTEFASVVQGNANVTLFYGDPTTGKLYCVISDVIYEWDADEGSKMTMDWMSKEWQFPKPINLGAAKMDADFTMTSDQVAAAQAALLAIQAANALLIAASTSKGSMNGHSLNTYSLNGSAVKNLPTITWDSLTFILYIDNAIKFSKTIIDNKMFRLPAGYKSDNAAFRVTGNVTVKSFAVAEIGKALEKV